MKTIFVVLITVAATCATAQDVKVKFIVGDLLPSEGGNWDPKSSPLDSPFGVDFNTDGEMFIVELGGGRVHKRSPDGMLKHISGDGSKSYQGDGGPVAKATYNGMHNCAVTPAGDLYIVIHVADHDI